MDLADILLHAMIAVTGVGLLGLFKLRIAVLFNTFFWPIREIIQHYPDVEEVITHPQSLLEWVVPVALGLLIGVIYKIGYKNG